MRLVDADVLLDNIRRDSKKAIDEGDKVGSFWLGYAAGLVIKQPTIQSALDPETLIRTIETGITATNSSDAYSLGMRNGMRWCKSLIDGVEPKFEEMSVDNGKDLPSIQPEKAQLSKEGTTFDTISRQAAIDALDKRFDSIPMEQTAEVLKLRKDLRELPSTQPEHKVRFADKDHVWIDGKQYISLPRFQEAVKEAQPKEGHWIEVAGELECSECHTVFTDLYPDYADSVACPHCGTKMTISTK